MAHPRLRQFPKCVTWRARILAACCISEPGSCICTIFLRTTYRASGLKENTRYCINVDFAPCQQSPQDWKGDWRHFARSTHPGGVNLMMADTSTRFVADSINEDLWKALATPKGDETIGEDF